MPKSWRSTFHQSSRHKHSRSSGQENCHCDAKVNLTPNSTVVSSPSKWTELTRRPLPWGLEMFSTSIGDCFSAFMNTEVCDVSQYSQLFANQSSCFSRITSFPPTVNPPLQTSCCHCATVLQSLLAVLWFWSRCPPPPFWCRTQFYNSLKVPYVLGAALLGSLAPSQRKLCCFWFLHLPETACIPWVVAPSSNF